MSHLAYVTRWLALLLLIAFIHGCKKDAPSTDTAASQPASASTRQLTIAAAADLQFALGDIVSRFQQRYPDIQIQSTYGSSGTLFAQLNNKAPFDVFLSADLSYPRKLIESQLAVKKSEFTYAQGRIVIWAPNSSPLDPAGKRFSVLLDPSIRKIAIANPQHAPYGRAAEAAMQKHALWEKLHNKLVLGENIGQAAQFVQSGAADVGIIALPLVMAPPMKDQGKYFLVPTEDYPRMEQGGVILSGAKDQPAAESFRAFLLGAEGRAVLTQYGFELPKE